MKTSYTKLLEAMTRKDWQSANERFADIMEQKVAQRLAQEKMGLHEAVISMKCLECGKTFKSANPDPSCPKCGGSDIDLGESCGKIQEGLNGKSLSVLHREMDRAESAWRNFEGGLRDSKGKADAYNAFKAAQAAVSQAEHAANVSMWNKTHVSAGQVVTVNPTPKSIRREHPAANWITQPTRVKMLDDSPHQGTLDVADVEVIATGKKASVYDFNIV
jgi:hypothetical protein